MIIDKIGGKEYLSLSEDQIDMANEEAWSRGITWAKLYVSVGYGAGEKGWGSGSEYGPIPEEKRRMFSR